MINSIARRIVKLSARDPSRQVFGAKTHNYVSSPILVFDLEEFETECGCGLPTDYRSFLTRIGTGVGPYYGLLSLGKIREELQMIAEDYLSDNGVGAKPYDPFELEAQILALQGQDALDYPPLKCPSTPGGFIPICHQGCEFMTVLITAGACTGLVMDTTNFASTYSEWYPSKCPPGMVEYGRNRIPILDFPLWPSFLEWIDGWLRQSEADLE